MTSAVNSTATIDDDDITSNSYKRRRSSIISSNEISNEQSPLKRVRSSSPTNLQTMFSCLNDIVQSHRNLVREYIDLQMRDRTDLSIDEQRFIKAEEDLIEKVEKNLQDINTSLTLKQLPNKLSVDRVKHESNILKRIDELKSNGKWSNQRLVKYLEPKKRKTHWDYLLDEMRWLAEDFAHEKRWKQMMAKKLSLAILKYFREKNQAENQQQRDEIKRLRKQALFVCKEVMNFWKNMHKIAEYKETTRIQELRKHQLDLHLNFIVDQTEKYSDWLVKSLKTETNDDDEDFNVTDDMHDDDNEETIEREEQDEQDDNAVNEIKELEADQEESIDALLKRYYGIDISNSSSEKENNIPIEIKQNDNEKNDSSEQEDDDDDDDDNEEEEESTNELTKNKEMNDLATTAQALQPTGFTLNTTQVKTPVPFLLKHSLREYQHVGLDWLVTLYENKLNCILADEMGLGKTIQTIALLAHLACEKGVWGPHLIVVPTSVMLNWELEFKKWCPSFKILTYYGSVKERQLKRQGWTKVNAFHVCITSYKLVLQDAKAFRRKKWKYLILDEAQNIKNFKSQRWQTLLNFHSQRRLLLTGTPLQNSLMELWSLMHFLMPNLFSSHQEFREWFSNPLTEMIEQGQMNSNDLLIKRLHKVLRPFILRRLKIDVEKQMPKKHEHIIMCNLSKRQRQLYDDFIQCRSTRDVIQQGHYMSVINILMQLRKVCNHPDLFESRPIISPLTIQKKLINYEIPKLIENIDLKNPYLNFNLPPNDTFLCFRIKFTLQATRDMILDSINHIDDNNRQVIQLTSDIIERYRNSSLWYQTNTQIRITRNRQLIKMITPADFVDDEFQPENIYFEICKQRQRERLSRYELLCRLNTDRCQSRPLYGSDVLTQVELAMRPSPVKLTPIPPARVDKIKTNISLLISRNTVEENILKKANQKRLLGDLTIDGGSFDVNYFKKNNIRDLFDQSSTLEDIVRERNDYQQQLDSSRAITTLDEQLRPIERYALRCVEAYRQEYQLAQVAPNTCLDAEQIRKDWQLSRLKSLKEEEERQLEQEDDEMMYTYALDKERQTKYSYTYSAAQNSLIANELARHEKSSAAIAANQPPPPPTVILPPTPPPPSPLPPPPRPVIIKRSTQIPTENLRRRRIQPSPLPPPPTPSLQPAVLPSPPPPALIQKPSRIIKQQQTSSHITNNRHNSNDDCGDSTTLLVADDFDDDDFDNNNRIYSSKSKTTLSTITRKPITNLSCLTQNSSSSSSLSSISSNTTTNGQQQIWIVNSLDQQSVLSLINYINPNSTNNSRSTGSILLSNKSNINPSPVTNLLTQQQPRSSTTAGTVYQIRSSQQQQQQQQPQQQQQQQQQQHNVVYQIQNGRIFQSTKKTT
ncbi:unnamed protein product [Rotaria sp. Silwood1]|nr:unnamed protein product [Rotaria sp. Silwood1]